MHVLRTYTFLCFTQYLFTLDILFLLATTFHFLLINAQITEVRGPLDYGLYTGQ